MKNKFATITLVLASGLIAGTPALAGVTREQVKAELAEAIRTGDMPAHGEESRKLNELYPHLYPARQAQASPALMATQISPRVATPNSPTP